MDSEKLVMLIAQACLRARELYESSWDASQKRYLRTRGDCAEEAANGVDLPPAERSLMSMCVHGGFQGEFVDWAGRIVKGE